MAFTLSKEQVNLFASLIYENLDAIHDYCQNHADFAVYQKEICKAQKSVPVKQKRQNRKVKM